MKMVTNLCLVFYFAILPCMTENPCYWKQDEPKSFPFKFSILFVLSLETVWSMILICYLWFFFVLFFSLRALFAVAWNFHLISTVFIEKLDIRLLLSVWIFLNVQVCMILSVKDKGLSGVSSPLWLFFWGIVTWSWGWPWIYPISHVSRLQVCAIMPHLCATRDKTEGFMYVSEALYQLSHTPSLKAGLEHVIFLPCSLQHLTTNVYHNNHLVLSLVFNLFVCFVLLFSFGVWVYNINVFSPSLASLL